MSVNRLREEIIQRSAAQEDKCFATAESALARLDLRWNGGRRLSLPYSYIQDIELTPKGVEGKFDLLTFTVPNNYYVEVLGHGLEQVYESLNRLVVRYLRAAQDDEAAGSGVVITQIKAYKLVNPVDQIKVKES